MLRFHQLFFGCFGGMVALGACGSDTDTHASAAAQNDARWCICDMFPNDPRCVEAPPCTSDGGAAMDAGTDASQGTDSGQGSDAGCVGAACTSGPGHLAFPASGNSEAAMAWGGENNRGAWERYWSNGEQAADLPRIHVVSNTNNSGPGSLRAALQDASPKIVLFTTSGYYRPTTQFSIRSDYTELAGQTSPAGFVFWGRTVNIWGNYLVLRFFKARNGADVDKGDSFTIMSRDEVTGHVIVDHCSFSWGGDENNSFIGNPDGTTGLTDVTLQWSMNYEGKGSPRYGSLLKYGLARFAGIRNYYAMNNQRSPQLASVDGFLWLNNLVYNWGGRGITHNTQVQRANYIRNYYRVGPASNANNGYLITQNGPDPAWYTNQIFSYQNYHSTLRPNPTDAAEWSMWRSSQFKTAVNPNEDPSLAPEVPTATGGGGQFPMEEGHRKGSWSGTSGKYKDGVYTADTHRWDYGFRGCSERSGGR